MKKFSLTLMVVGLLFAASTAYAKVNVFACEPEWASLAKEIGGEHVKVFSATHGLQDPHHVRARPSLLAKMRKADLLICSGAELESGWLPILQQKAGQKNVQPDGFGYLEAAYYVPMLDLPKMLDRSMGDVHASGNPHVHLDPRNISIMAAELSKKLQRLDLFNRQFYQDAEKDFQQRWSTAITGWTKRAEKLKGTPVAIQHKNWSYLFNWIGLELVATLEPVPGVPPGTGHLKSLLEDEKAKQAKFVVYAAYQNGKAADWFSQHTGAKAVMLPYTVGGTDSAVDLFSLFDETLKKLGV